MANLKYQKTFRLLHFILAMIGIFICAILTLAFGHPSGIFIAPELFAVWPIGHGILYGIRRIAIKGLQFKTNNSKYTGRWPKGLLIIVYILGILSFFGILLLGPLYLPGLFILYPICFFSLLLRCPWSRIFIIATFWYQAALVQIFFFVAYFTSQASTAWNEVVVLIVITLFFFLLGLYVQRSQNIRFFLTDLDRVNKDNASG